MTKSSGPGSLPKGWSMSGSNPSHYQAVLDNKVTRGDCATVCIFNKKENAAGFGTWMTTNKPDLYLGNRVRLKMWLKTDEVAGRVQPWMRIDGPEKETVLAFDNFCQRAVESDTEWTEYETVLEVPEASTLLAYGVILAGQGKVWMDEVSLEIVDDSVPTTNCPCLAQITKTPKTKRQKIKTATEVKDEQSATLCSGWALWGSHPELYVATLDTTTFHSGTRSALLKNRLDEAVDFGALIQYCSPNQYRGKRVRMTAWLKTKDVVSWAAPWFRVDGEVSCDCLSFDNCCKRPLKGSKDWTKYEIVLQVHEASTKLAYGVLLSGVGNVWLDDITFEVVDNTVPTTDCPCQNSSHINLNFEDN